MKIRSETAHSWTRASETVFAAVLSIVLMGGLYALTGDIDLDLGDEGYLWYGVQQTAAGSVPMRDFQSYDPGRYYWGAAWTLALGPGILALRLSSTVFAAIGLFCGLLAGRRVVANRWALIPIGCILAAWMFPRHKLFESSLSMIAVYVAVRLIEAPSVRRHFVAGAFAGLAAFFGRNHGLYAALGFSLVILLLHSKLREGTLLSKLGAFAGGIGIGYTPLLAMLAFVPGFAERFVVSVVRHVTQGTNIPRPVPWPWRVAYGELDWLGDLAAFSIGAAFVALAVAYPLGIFVAWRTRPECLKRRALLIASACIGIFYAHHTWVRSSEVHLAQCIHPLLLGLIAIPHSFRFRRPVVPRLAIWGSVAIATASVAFWSSSALLSKIPIGPNARPLVSYPVAGDPLRFSPEMAAELWGVERVIERRVPPDESLLIAPYAVSYYPMLGRTSPLWRIYFLRPMPGENRQIVQSLEEQRVDWILIVNHVLIGNEEIRMTRTYPKLVRYLMSEFEEVPDGTLPFGHQLFRRRTLARDR